MGPGPSATSVEVRNDVVTLGSAVLITGTATDQTPIAQLKSTAAVADADQEKQMEFLIQHSINQPNVIGVPVTLYAIENSGNVIPKKQLTDSAEHSRCSGLQLQSANTL